MSRTASALIGRSFGWSARGRGRRGGARIVGVGLGQDAVAEVEDVPGAAAGCGEDPSRHARLDRLARPEEQRGVEVALDAARSPTSAQAVGRGRSASRAPMTSPPASACRRRSRPCRRRSGCVGRRGRRGRRTARRSPGQHVAVVVERAEAADPGVEDLDRLGAGRDLGAQVADAWSRRGGPSARAHAPGSRVHEGAWCAANSRDGPPSMR